MDDLVAFIEARLAEDEATARSVKPLGHTDALGGIRIEHEFAVTRLVASGEDGSYRSEADKAAAAHFRRHDPARVLREVAVKRRLLDWAQDRLHDAEDFPADEQYRLEAMGVLRLHLPLLALPYSDHPGFRPEWNTEDVDHG